ncbi:hypothetical protein D3C84_930400 [compost metagenome]
MPHQMIPTQSEALIIQRHLHQQAVVVAAEVVRAFRGRDLQVMGLESEPHIPVDLFRQLGTAIRVQVQQHAVAHALQSPQFWMRFQITRRAHGIDDFVKQGDSQIAGAQITGLGDENVRNDSGLHHQKMLGGDDIQVDIGIGAEEVFQSVG